MSFWAFLSTATSPSPRSHSVMILDENTLDVLMFGGEDGTNFLYETWKWDGSDWTELFPANTPTAAPGNQILTNDLGWDGVNGVPMLVMKEDSGTPPAVFRFFYFDWVTPDWVEIFPATVPTGGVLFDSRFTWMPTTSKSYLFVGSGGTAWEWDGTDFTDTGQTIPEPSTPPGPNVSAFTATYDPIQEAIVEYGGKVPEIIYWKGTSLWDGSAWTLQSPITDAGIRSSEPGKWAAWSDSCKCVVIYDGDTSGGEDSTTYGYRGSIFGYDWFHFTPAAHPTAVLNVGMCTDANGNVLLFGGVGPGPGHVYQNETWVFSCPQFVPQMYRRRG